MHKKAKRETIIKWLTICVAAGGLVLGIVNLLQNQRLNRINDALKIEQLIAEVTDLMYFGDGEELITRPISPRRLELAGRRISEILIIDPHNAEGLKLAAQ